MTTLNDYLQEVQILLRDTKQDLLDPDDIRRFINTARREIAMRTQCLRVLPNISAPVISTTVVQGGHSYSASPAVVITPPDFPSGVLPFPNGSQATATASVAGGVIQSVNIVSGGSGYFQPQVTITDPTGSGAVVAATAAPINTLNQGQEVYKFSSVDLTAFPGIDSILAVQSISVIYSNYRYSLPVYSFSIYQSMIRQYPFQYQYVPTFASQFGQGAAGSFYVYPLPSQTYQYELDAYCLPIDLNTNTDVEAIPKPWTDAVAYWAAYLSYLSIQNYNAARFYEDMFNRRVVAYSNYARPGRAVNPYGRF